MIKLNNILYIFLISGLIPATWLLFLSFLGLFLFLQRIEFSFNFFIAFCSIILGICGYVGLLLLLKGLHKTNHYKKLTFLISGFIGFLIFMLFVSPRNFKSWLLEHNFESILGKWPLIVSLIFSVLIIIDLIIKHKQDKTNADEEPEEVSL